MTTYANRQYEDLLRDILLNGAFRSDNRTGVATRSIFGSQLRYRLADGFPLITTKKVFTKGIIAELLWLLDGDTNVRTLQRQGVHIWDEWADENGDLGPIYGAQWRRWRTDDGKVIDQIQNVVDQIKANPSSRRLIVNAWNVGEIDKMALPPCHTMFQFYVANNRLSCKLYQRSADMFLGVPFNIASYALLTHMVAQQTGLQPGDFIWSGGDCHIYQNHFPQVREQLTRKEYPFPQLKLQQRPSLFEYRLEDFTICGYQHHPAIKGEVAV